MLFNLHGIKQVDGESVQFDLLIDTDTEDELKELSKELGMAILSLSVFQGQKNSYGDIYVKFLFKDSEYEIITKFDKIKDGYNFATNVLGVQISYMNSFAKPVDDERILDVLQKLSAEKQIEKTADKEKASEKAAIADKVVIQMRGLITDTINEAQTLYEQVEGKVPMELSRRLLNGIDDLKKFRISNNIEKMAEAYGSIIGLMEETEVTFIDRMKGGESNQLKDFLISDLDIVKEYEKFKSSKKALKGSKISTEIKLDSDQKFYSSFGKNGVYLKLFFTDVYRKFEKKKFGNFNLYSIVELLLIFILLELVLFLLFSKYVSYSDYINTAYYFIGFFGLMGIIILVMSKFFKDTILSIIWGLVGGLLIFAVLRYLVTLIFAI